MSILTRLLGHRRFNEELAPTRPGGWIAQDARTGRLTANLMLRLHTSMLETAVFQHLPLMLGPNIEVRAGVLARRALSSELKGWVEAHQSPDLEQIAQDSAKHVEKTGLRTVRQYLWLVAPVPHGAPPPTMDALLEELENYGHAFGSHLRGSCHPADDFREVATTYEQPSDPHGGIPPTACTFFPVQPNWTGYLQSGWGPLDSAHRVVPELFHQTHTSFTVWVTAQALSRADCRRAIRDLTPTLQTLLAPGRTEHISQRRLAAEVGDLLRCKYQLTLHHCPKELQQQAQAAMRRHGLDFREESKGILEWRAPKKAFWAQATELAACCPYQALHENSLASSGLLLRTAAGTPFVFDPFNSDTDHNVMVTGGRGAGKDYLCRSLLSAHVAQGQPAWLIGAHSMAGTSALVDIAGGRSLALELGGSGLNPLGMCQDEDDVLTLRNWLASLIAPVVVELDSASLMRLERAMVMSWQHRNGPLSLEQVRYELEREDDALCTQLAQALAPYTRDGEYAALFSGEPLDLSTDSLLVLDTTAVSTANEPVLSMTLLAMLSLHWKQVRPVKRKMVYLDMRNAWARYDHQLTGAAALIQTILRRARMQNGAVLTCVPYEDLEAGRRPTVARAVAETSGWHVLMHVDRGINDGDDLRKGIGYPETVAELWPHAYTIPHRMARFVVSSWRGVQLLSLIPGKLQHALHADDELRCAAYRAARRQGMSPVEALGEASDAGKQNG